ncbi:hypothetical protein KS4_23160 [Poriferisphaera corsica]|uniref:Lipoprotein n=1 Tax=Poriferisphaera corsica TaxID=2528020 RepID=A0A517YVK9_9BACT|nr:hypothetical protein [Poriferisphaera corsica]QDU34250.1 hypothetical protein KS4_23160 [Poriferisphaera corsica]
MKLLAVVFSIVMLLTGCVQKNQTVNINLPEGIKIVPPLMINQNAEYLSDTDVRDNNPSGEFDFIPMNRKVSR